MQLIFLVILGLFLVMVLYWNPVQQDIISYLAFTIGSGFFFQDVFRNLGYDLYSFDEDQLLEILRVLVPVSHIFQLGNPDCITTAIYSRSDVACP